jgi:hypothetical protein
MTIPKAPSSTDDNNNNATDNPAKTREVAFDETAGSAPAAGADLVRGEGM